MYQIERLLEARRRYHSKTSRKTCMAANASPLVAVTAERGCPAAADGMTDRRGASTQDQLRIF
jgi:hypothetical protein